MEKKHMKRYSTSEQSLNIIGEIKIKSERSFHYTSIRMVKLKNIYIYWQYQMMKMRKTGTHKMLLECKILWVLSKIVHQFLIKFNKHHMTQISYTYIYILEKWNYVHPKPYTQFFLATLFVIANNLETI